MSRWDLVGGNPAPGDPGSVRRSASEYQRAADTGDRVATSLTSLSQRTGAGMWVGKAAEAFSRSISDDLLKDLREFSESYAGCSSALVRYAAKLDQMQGEARRHLHSAENAHRDKNSAQSRRDRYSSEEKAAARNEGQVDSRYRELRRRTYTSAYQDPDNWSYRNEIDRAIRDARSRRQRYSDQRQESGRKERAAAQDLSSSAQRLRGATDRIRQLKAERDGVVGRTVKRIDGHRKHRSVLRQFGDGVVNWSKEHLDEVADKLNQISMVSGFVALGLTAALPFVGAIPIVGPAVAGLAGAAKIISIGTGIAGTAAGVGHSLLNGDMVGAAVKLAIGAAPWGRLAKRAGKLIGRSGASAGLMKAGGKRASTLLRQGTKHITSTRAGAAAVRGVAAYAKKADVVEDRLERVVGRKLAASKVGPAIQNSARMLDKKLRHNMGSKVSQSTAGDVAEWMFDVDDNIRWGMAERVKDKTKKVFEDVALCVIPGVKKPETSRPGCFPSLTSDRPGVLR